MVLRPYSADLQQTFRATLLTPGAPEVIDDSEPVVPVAIVAGNLTATLPSTVTVTPSKKTAIPLSATSAGGVGSTTIGTVPALKVWRILSIAITVSGAARAQINLNGVASLHGISRTDTGSNVVTWNYEAAPVLTAAQTAVLQVTSAGNECAANISYVEEDA